MNILSKIFVYPRINAYLCIEIKTKNNINMKELDYLKEFTCGETTISREDYECMPSPMNTSALTDEDMQKLADAIEYEMQRWQEWLDNGDINQDQYNEHWWEVMETLGCNFGMTYYEDEE